MKILVLTSTYSRWAKDTEPKFVDNLCQQLAQQHTVHVLAPHAPTAATDETLDGVRVFRFRYCLERWQQLAYDGGIMPNLKEKPARLALVPLFMLAQLIAMARLVRKHDYDVIHAHWIIPQGFTAILLKQLLRRPPAVVVTSHGGDLFALRGAILGKLKRWICANTEVLTLVSSAMLKKASDEGYFSQQPPVWIPMGVDSQAMFASQNADIQKEGLLFVGRLVEKKGVEYLLQAMPKILEQHPQVKLRIVGDGPLKDTLIALRDSLHLGDAVTFLGALPNDAIPALLRDAEVLIFPSIVADNGDQEGTPVAIMEALASECATIVASYPGADDIIKHGETGILVPQKNPEAISDAAIALLDDNALASKLGKAGRRLIEETYDWRIISKQFEQTFLSAGGHLDSD